MRKFGPTTAMTDFAAQWPVLTHPEAVEAAKPPSAGSFDAQAAISSCWSRPFRVPSTPLTVDQSDLVSKRKRQPSRCPPGHADTGG